MANAKIPVKEKVLVVINHADGTSERIEPKLSLLKRFVRFLLRRS